MRAITSMRDHVHVSAQATSQLQDKSVTTRMATFSTSSRTATLISSVAVVTFHSPVHNKPSFPVLKIDKERSFDTLSTAKFECTGDPVPHTSMCTGCETRYASSTLQLAFASSTVLKIEPSDRVRGRKHCAAQRLQRCYVFNFTLLTDQ